ncbi:sigma-70 family RNA polymerase sigma factor [Streptomyces sp. NPDC046465]|uniref:RNA polymerase sigma factor n=1 Tax=Streptomyces sp. NPDC046465 TaxID=3155810 RepID=UPI0033E033EE
MTSDTGERPPAADGYSDDYSDGWSDACVVRVETLFRRYGKVVLRKATVAAAGNSHDGWEGCQHAFVQAGEHLRKPGAEEIRNWQGWLVKTAVRHAMSVYRRGVETVPLGEETDRDGGAMPVEDQVAVRETFRNLLEAIGELSERQRQALVLVHIAGCSTDEAAQDMGVTSSTVRNLIHQARSRLAVVSGETSDA